MKKEKLSNIIKANNIFLNSYSNSILDNCSDKKKTFNTYLLHILKKMTSNKIPLLPAAIGQT